MAEDKKSIPRRQSKPGGKGISKDEAKNNAKVIQTAHLQYNQQLEKERRKAKVTDMETVYAMLTEFMGPFILIGFDLNNESVELVNAKSSLERDALNMHLKRVFVDRVIKADE